MMIDINKKIVTVAGYEATVEYKETDKLSLIHGIIHMKTKDKYVIWHPDGRYVGKKTSRLNIKNC